jgi:alpha-beta hydrolase superfamily lysophospholipase
MGSTAAATPPFSQVWRPQGAPRALVVISHGLAEHSGRYVELAGRLTARGYAVHALDHHGHGRSGGRRSNIGRFTGVVSDLGEFIRRSREEYAGLPTILLGHSMGGAIAYACALEHQDELRGLVLSAPALAPGEHAPPLKLLLVRLLSFIAPNTGVLNLPAEAISRDPAVVAAYDRDPLVYRGAVPARTMAELVMAMAAFPARAPELRLPILVQHGTGDLLVPLVACQPIYERLGDSRTRTVKLYDGLYHEVYNEPERDRVIGDLLDWLDAQL